jgi:hypothetical protein
MGFSPALFLAFLHYAYPLTHIPCCHSKYRLLIFLFQIMLRYFQVHIQHIQKQPEDSFLDQNYCHISQRL